ncbi:CLUMA_CG004634, isoform A [Clunio marinus]|uniref:CLUMA_CG004634, isoform A n=1 Tax=Clunio marinus TaxID=568069 RepID=A0A1J1HXR5_9DIPT|nr:CLUMA_CG004634, isoform A [Clunio marinus]
MNFVECFKGSNKIQSDQSTWCIICKRKRQKSIAYERINIRDFMSLWFLVVKHKCFMGKEFPFIILCTFDMNGFEVSFEIDCVAENG